MITFLALAIVLGAIGWFIRPIVRLLVLLALVGWVAQALGYHG
jgi:hypothetical protein